MKWLQYGLGILGLGALADAGYLISKALVSQHEGIHELARPTSLRPVAGGIFGLLEVPRLDLSVIVFEGSTDDILDRGAGHLMESASLSDTGNVALAGHRDTFFRPLRKIRIGDVIKLRTVSAEREYIVESTRVVAPTDVSVIGRTSESVLTLVTCYPFQYIGPAPDRFVVRAKATTPRSVSVAALR